MSDVKVGRLIDASEQRDAIHIAIAPVIATETLRPGQRVGFISEDRERVSGHGKPLIGIVDPFLDEHVQPGERFWMCLYPQTITSLRHDWTHPAFVNAAPALSASESFLRYYADKVGVSYGALLEAAHDKNHGGDGHRLPSDIPNEVYDDLDEMWRHYEIVTGDKVATGLAPFWCSC